jgi:hypothetical protein
LLVRPVEETTQVRKRVDLRRLLHSQQQNGE